MNIKKILPQTKNITDENVENIAQLLPQVVTESTDESGNIKKVVDFELLKQHLSDSLVDGSDERYRLDWPGKRASILKANTPINKTLRPDRESSVNFDETENVYIEGDNFEVLKVLQESYLGKIKMIYIDPPYNTGTAMIYNNDFSVDEKEYAKELGAYDDEGVKMFKNTDTDGRIHSNWLSFMYERISVARDLLCDEGFVVLAIDHYELNNLITVCNEIFGEENRIGVVSVVHKPEGRNQEKFFGTSNEFMLVFAKNKDVTNFNSVAISEEVLKKFDRRDENGLYRLNTYINKNHGKSGKDTSLRINRPEFWYPVYVSPDLKDITLTKKNSYYEVFPISNTGQERTWRTKPETLIERLNDGLIVAEEVDGGVSIFEKYYESQVIKTHWIESKYHATHFGTKLINNLLGGSTFDFPKSLFLLIDILKLTTKETDIVLDFFSGSATTAHATMQLNAEDGGNRKFIMVQLPEKTDEKSEAFRAGYKTISEIGMERIRRAGNKIVEENAEKLAEREIPLDTGFRVYKTDSSNIKDVYYNPAELKQENLLDAVDNIKDDRTSEDLLTQVVLDLGLTLDLRIEKTEIDGSEVFHVAGNSLIACFDADISDTVLKTIAESEPIRVVFRDSSFKQTEDKINVETIFKSVSPDTKIIVL